MSQEQALAPETWQEGEIIPPRLMAHIRERIILATGIEPQCVLTAALAERYYPKAEYLKRGHCCGPTDHQ